jgi:hypothetical protein
VQAAKNSGSGTWFGIQSNGDRYPGQPGNPVNGVKQHGSGAEWFDTGITKHSSRSSARKHASALIAKIPEPLSRHIGRIFHPGG